jgi:hypothetical protein
LRSRKACSFTDIFIDDHSMARIKNCVNRIEVTARTSERPINTIIDLK